MARIALGRTGDALPTCRVLDFQLAHAQARDAVHHPLDVERSSRDLDRLGPVQVCSQAANRTEYLKRPDLAGNSTRIPPPRSGQVPTTRWSSLRTDFRRGRCRSTDRLWRSPCTGRGPIGLRPRTLRPSPRRTWQRHRQALGAALVVVLIGERPGLSAADSLGACIAWRPRPGVTRNEERNCVSDIPSGWSFRRRGGGADLCTYGGCAAARNDRGRPRGGRCARPVHELSRHRRLE